MLVGRFVMMLLNSRIRCGLDMSEITFVICIGPLHVCTPASVGLLDRNTSATFVYSGGSHRSSSCPFDDTEIPGLSEDG